jgi:hypothetical protein
MSVEAPAKPAPTVVWQGADRLLVKLTGGVSLSPVDDEDREFFDGLEGGADVRFRVSGVVTGSALNWQVDSEGDFTTVVAQRRIQIISIYPE